MHPNVIKFAGLFLLSLILVSCNSDSTTSQTIDISARNEGIFLAKPTIYRMKVPTSWQIHRPAPNESLVDTTKALIEFEIQGECREDSTLCPDPRMESLDKIRITVHNFPADSLEKRIPPSAQVSRWKRQLGLLDSKSELIKAQSFAGYYGLLLEAVGMVDQKKIAVLGWALQVAPEHFRALQKPAPIAIEQRHRQMRGDVTIKAVGPEVLMEKYRQDIFNFAHSFQLIDDIP